MLTIVPAMLVISRPSGGVVEEHLGIMNPNGA